jgi:hypothetical protein
MSCRSRLVALAVLALALLALPALAAKEKGRRVDLVSTVPDFASFGVKSIAMLPVATFDRNYEAERVVATLWGKDFKDTGYRWISANVAREMLLSTIGDSTLKLVSVEILKSARVDSLRAPLLCAKLRTDAVLSVRVDQWEQRQVLPVDLGFGGGVVKASGKPSTSVQLKAALVDSTGTLLWSASGSETGEGTMHEASENTVGVKYTGLSSLPLTDQGAPPLFVDVVDRLLVRWAPLFPRAGAASEPAK